MCLFSELSVISPIILLTFLLFACSYTKGNHTIDVIQTEDSTIAKPDRFQEESDKVSGHAENILWNSNENASSTVTMKYVIPDPTKITKSAESHCMHHRSNPHRHSSKKHHQTRRHKKRKHNRKTRHRDRLLKASQNMTKNDAVAPDHESILQNKTANSIRESMQACSTCRLNQIKDERTVKKIRIQAFVNTLAEKLRITPEELFSKNRSKPLLKLPDEMLEEALHDSPEEQEADHFYAKNERIILPGYDMGRKCINRGTTGCYRFDLRDRVSVGLISGQLWVYKTPDRHDSHIQTFFVYRLEKSNNGSIRVESLIHRHETSVRKGWVSIPINGMKLQENGDAEVMVAIRCATCTKRSHRSLFGAKHNYTPLLVIESSKLIQSRHKRDIEDGNCDPSARCCKRSLEVNFRELGILFTPDVVDIGYCRGECGFFEGTYNHTNLMQNLKNTGGHDHLKICCVPIDFRGRRLMVSNGRIVYFPNMVVRRCGCI